MLEDYSASDHLYVSYSLERNVPEPTEEPTAPVKWAFRKIDPGAVARKLHAIAIPESTMGTVDEASEWLHEFLVEACDSCMPRRFGGETNRRPAHWWNNEIADLRATCNTQAGLHKESLKSGSEQLRS